MGQALRQTDNTRDSSSRRRRGVQPPLLNQVANKSANPPSPPAHEAENTPNRRIEMGRLLKSCGVRFYWSLAKDYPAELIEAKVAEWREGSQTGPGMLVKMIQAGGPVLEVEARGDPEAEWLQRRYERGGRGTL